MLRMLETKAVIGAGMWNYLALERSRKPHEDYFLF
jgi:hypothetical protein